MALAAEVPDLEDRLRVLDALDIPTRTPDSLPEGAPTDHFGRLQSQDALHHARALLDAIGSALAAACGRVRQLRPRHRFRGQ
jgi:hypothetical protein